MKSSSILKHNKEAYTVESTGIGGRDTEWEERMETEKEIYSVFQSEGSCTQVLSDATKKKSCLISKAAAFWGLSNPIILYTGPQVTQAVTLTKHYVHKCKFAM